MDDIKEKQIKELQSRIKYLRSGLVDIYQDLVSKPMKSRDYKDALRLLKKTQNTLDYKGILEMDKKEKIIGWRFAGKSYKKKEDCPISDPIPIYEQ